MDNMLEIYEWLTAWERYNTGQKRETEGDSPKKRKKVKVPKKDSKPR
jgi:hypothetical protein